MNTLRSKMSSPSTARSLTLLSHRTWGISGLLALGVALLGSGSAHAQTYSFGVLSQRSAVLTANYWNPILDYVKRKTGIDLQLKLARSASESIESISRGEYDFVYSNNFFLPRYASAGYQVILKPREEAIKGQIVTLPNSPIKSLKDLDGRDVGFPSPVAFVGYAVPMDALLRQGVKVTPDFGGNQEGTMAQLKTGRVAAAAVNGSLMKAFAAREGFQYRVIWESVAYNNLPIAVHPRVPKPVLTAVKNAIDGMEGDAEGRTILEETAKTIGQAPPYGFNASSQSDYRNYIEFYKNTVVPELK
ncbi:phosphate/phosphite/phosphonate ABC transporter substrate-binding protein [Aquabacterium sp.]|uniref:phosphate/phosphite/phosphonate ABC transporter substrate-binding protein n=1 Tax=Aquabacterium sp. TaxID=1872578 RepID=UPI0035B30A88